MFKDRSTLLHFGVVGLLVCVLQEQPYGLVHVQRAESDTTPLPGEDDAR